MLISFVIPCYKSKDTVGHVVDTIQSIVDAREDYEAEIILVNDCSPDGTFDTIKALTEKYNNVVGIDIAKNMGQQCALMAGFKQARGELIFSCDDDGQTPIETAFTMIEKLENENYDVVCANYIDRGHRSLFRRLGSWANDTMVKVCLEKPDEINPSVYFVARRFVIEEVIRYGNPFPYWTGLLLRTTHNVGNIELEQKDRMAGESGYTMKKLLKLWVNGITTFSIKPLRFATILGALLAIAGFAIIIVLAIVKLTNDNIALGWTSLIATNILIGGLILLVLGVIGEYIGRIYISMNRSPQYVIRTIIDNREEESK